MPRPRRLIRRETIEPHVRRRRITYGYDIPSDSEEDFDEEPDYDKE